MAKAAEADRVEHHAAAIKANADAFHSRRIGWGVFNEAARKLWAAVPVHMRDAVTQLVCPMVDGGAL